MELKSQVATLLVLAIPIACIAWTVTHEEIFGEVRRYCTAKSESCQKLYKRKFFYLFTCEFCFSHYVAAFLLLMTNFRLIYEDWRGLFIAFFSLVWIGNIYMSLFGYLRQSLKTERLEANLKDNEWRDVKEENKQEK